MSGSTQFLGFLPGSAIRTTSSQRRGSPKSLPRRSRPRAELPPPNYRGTISCTTQRPQVRCTTVRLGTVCFEHSPANGIGRSISLLMPFIPFLHGLQPATKHSIYRQSTRRPPRTVNSLALSSCIGGQRTSRPSPPNGDPLRKGPPPGPVRSRRSPNPDHFRCPEKARSQTV